MAEPASALTRGLALSLLAGCASTPPSSLVPEDLLVAIEVADELERDRQFALARAQLEAAVEHADTIERADSLRLRICELWARAGDPERARGCYAGVTLESPEERALAAYRVAAIDLDLGDRAGARARMLGVVEQYPESDAAHRSLRGARALAREEGGAASEVELLIGTADRLRERAGTDAAVLDLRLEALVGASQVLLEDDPKRAEALAGAAVAEAMESRWLDDALVWHARALARLGSHERALARYQRLVDERESSWFVGSYDSVFLDDALFERAALLEEIGRIEQARSAYQLLITEVPDSRLVDDAAFRVARLAGDRETLEKFVVEYPESRHVREARELLEGP